MKPERQNHVIAEICGYKPLEHSVNCFGEHKTWTQWTRPDLRLALDEAPDYLGDLNVCAEMEKTLTDVQLGMYAMWLERLVETFNRNKLGFYPVTHFIWHATPAQRCGAFLRMHGKWEEAK